MCDAFEALFAAYYYESYNLETLLKLLIEKTNVFILDRLKDDI